MCSASSERAARSVVPCTASRPRRSTRARQPDPTTGAVIPPIHPSSTYAQDGVGGTRSGYEYSRSANPTRTALQECLAALEGGRHAVAFGSGMGASDVLLRVLLSPGDHIVIPHDAYGGTFRLVDKVLRPWGIEHTPVDLADVHRAAGGAAPRDPGDLVRDARPTRCWASPTSPRWPTSPARPRPGSSSTTRSPRPTCSRRSRSAPTSCCTPPPSTSAATPTSSAER